MECRMNTKELVFIALKAGEILIKSGAEIFRAEDTIVRICTSYGANCESFALPTGIFISVTGKDGNTEQGIKRIGDRTVDLHRIESVNNFSRSLQEKSLSYSEALKVLNEIEVTRTYSFKLRLICAGIAAFVFTVLFRGTVIEGLAAMPAGMVIFIIKEKISKIGFFQFIEFFISGMVAASISLITVKIFPEISIYRVIIGSIIILLPGVAITNSIRDALYGDIVSSMSRLGEAFLIAIALSVGVGIALILGLNWM